MKITTFLKNYSLIDNRFIDDFYYFFDEGKNEYDFSIKLELISNWLEARKDHLKRLLVSNFTKDVDYIEMRRKGTGRGKSNCVHVILSYECAKLLCMISKCEKATMVRNYYIELEKLIIAYKDNIVNDLNNQLGINDANRQVIHENNGIGTIYVLKVDDEVRKIGRTIDLKKRMKMYNVGKINELPIVYVYRTKNINEVEKCVKKNLDSYRVKKHKNNELFKIDDDFIKDTLIYCNKSSIKVRENRKLLKTSKDKNWLIIIDKESIDENTTLNKNLHSNNASVKKISKTQTKNPSKILSKKPSKTQSKTMSKKPMSKSKSKSKFKTKQLSKTISKNKYVSRRLNKK